MTRIQKMLNFSGTGTDPAPDPADKTFNNFKTGSGAGSVPVPASV